MHPFPYLLYRLPAPRTMRSGQLLGVVIAACWLLSPAPATSSLKLKPHPTRGATADVDRLFNLIKQCMGKTDLTKAADGTLSVGPAPSGGDSKFAAAIRTIIGGAAVEVEAGRDIPGVTVGAFRANFGGADARKTTGVQTLDVDDIEKLPDKSDCSMTKWSALIHELWELYTAKLTFATDGQFPNAHAEAIKKENEVNAEINPNGYGRRVESRDRNRPAKNVTSESYRADSNGTRNPNGSFWRITNEIYFPYDCVGGPNDGKKTQMVVVRTWIERSDASRAFISGPQVVQVLIDTGSATKRIVVTNPDPMIQLFDMNRNFLTEYENYPGDSQSRPGHLAAGADGHLYIAEELKNTVEIRDALTNSAIHTITNPAIDSPRGVAYFESGLVFVASFNNNRILAFDADGNFQYSFTNAALNGPTDILIANDKRFDNLDYLAYPDNDPLLFVCNSGSNNVLIFQLDGTLVGSLNDANLSFPSGIAQDPLGNTFVSSFQNDKIVMFDVTGARTGILSNSMLDGPQGIALELDGPVVNTLMVASKLSQRVVQFDSVGSVSSFSTANTLCPKGIALVNRAVTTGFRQDVTLPVELVGFDLASADGRVYLEWRTASEVGNVGFEVQRSGDGDTNFLPIVSYLNDPSLRGAGTSSHGRNYNYIDGLDGSLRPGSLYSYRLVDVALDGTRTIHQPSSIRVESGGERRISMGLPC